MFSLIEYVLMNYLNIKKYKQNVLYAIYLKSRIIIIVFSSEFWFNTYHIILNS